MSDKLKPCPHCGGEAVYEHATFMNPNQTRCVIVCESCGAYGGPALGSNRDLVEARATELWNKRQDIRCNTLEVDRVIEVHLEGSLGAINAAFVLGVSVSEFGCLVAANRARAHEKKKAETIIVIAKEDLCQH